MKDLIKVEDPDSHGGITLEFSDGATMRVRVGPDGRLECETS